MPTEFIGYFGAAFLIVAYFLLSKKFLSIDNYKYHLMNFIGCALLIWSNCLIKNYPVIYLNLVFLSLALYNINKTSCK